MKKIESLRKQMTQVKFIQRHSIKIKLSIGKDKWARSVRIYTSRNRQNRHNVFVHVVKHLI